MSIIAPRGSKDAFLSSNAMEHRCIKLCRLRGSRILEDQDNRSPTHHSLGAFQSLHGRAPLANSPPYPVEPSCTHTYIGTHTHVHTVLSATPRLSRPGISKSTTIPSWPRDGNWGRPCPRSPKPSEIQLMYNCLQSLRFTNRETEAQRRQ